MRLCPKCLNPRCPDSSQPITADHVVALFNGGTNYIWNIQPLCKSCNSSSGTGSVDYRPVTTMTKFLLTLENSVELLKMYQEYLKQNPLPES